MYRVFLKHSHRISIASASVLCWGIWGPSALAQGFDQNLQTRVEILSPPPPQVVVTSKTKRVLVKPEQIVEETLTTEERAEIAKERNIAPPAGILAFTPKQKNAFFDTAGIPRKRVIKKKAQYATRKEPRKTQIYFNVNSSYSYESNANTSSVDPTGDDIANLTTGLTIAVPVGPQSDTLSVFFGTGSARYDRLDSLSFDSLSGGINFVKLLGTQSASGAKGAATSDQLLISFRTKSVYTPGFDTHQAAFYTPSIGWSRQNIGLDRALCPIGTTKNYCYFADVSFNVGHSWSDIGALGNANSTLAVTAGWRTPVKGLTLKTTGSVTGKYFTDRSDGRKDLFYAVSSNLEWQVASNVTFDAGVSYNWQDSTISTLNWDGLGILPQARLNVQLR